MKSACIHIIKSANILAEKMCNAFAVEKVSHIFWQKISGVLGFSIAETVMSHKLMMLSVLNNPAHCYTIIIYLEFSAIFVEFLKNGHTLSLHTVCL